MLAALNQKYKPQVRLLILVFSLIFLYQMSEVEQELRKYKDSLRKVLEEMCNSAMTRYDLTSELGIYGQLLTYEETRMTTHSSEVLGIPLDIRLLIQLDINLTDWSYGDNVHRKRVMDQFLNKLFSSNSPAPGDCEGHSDSEESQRQCPGCRHGDVPLLLLLPRQEGVGLLQPGVKVQGQDPGQLPGDQRHHGETSKCCPGKFVKTFPTHQRRRL